MGAQGSRPRAGDDKNHQYSWLLRRESVRTSGSLQARAWGYSRKLTGDVMCPFLGKRWTVANVCVWSIHTNSILCMHGCGVMEPGERPVFLDSQRKNQPCQHLDLGL